VIDDPDDTPTGRTLALVARVEGGDMRPLAHELGSQRRLLESLLRDRTRAEGAAWVVRALGGVAAAVAITLAGYALSLAQTAAVDHERVTRLRQDADALTVASAEHRTQISAAQRDAAGAAATLLEVRSALLDLRTEMREMRREVAGERGRR